MFRKDVKQFNQETTGMCVVCRKPTVFSHEPIQYSVSYMLDNVHATLFDNSTPIVRY